MSLKRATCVPLCERMPRRLFGFITNRVGGETRCEGGELCFSRGLPTYRHAGSRCRRRPAMLPPRVSDTPPTCVAEGGEPCLTAGERASASVTRGQCASPSNRPQRGRTAPTRHHIMYTVSYPRTVHGRLSAAMRTAWPGLALVRPRWGRLIERLHHPRVTLRSPAVFYVHFQQIFWI